MLKNLKILGLCAVLLVSACKTDRDTTSEGTQAKGGVYYGGVFRYNEVENYKSFFPLFCTLAPGWRIADQVYEGLVDLDQVHLTIKNELAERYEYDEARKTYTFHLKEGVNFHDDVCFDGGKGREMTAKDFKYCFDMLCTADVLNQGFLYSFKDKVAGANEYYASTEAGTPLEGGVSGIKVIDDYTLEIELNYEFGDFLNILTMSYCWVWPKEAYDMYGGAGMREKAVGTGPFKLKSVKDGESVILVRNDSYWGVDEYGNSLPYLDAIQVSFIPAKETELLEFRKGNLDLVYNLPNEYVNQILDKFSDAKDNEVGVHLQIHPALTVEFYSFQHMHPIEVFHDKRVRQAFNYAIDKDKIVDFTLQGDGIPAHNGIVPSSFLQYNHKSLQGYSFDAEKAQSLMAEAGYGKGGKTFPNITIDINSGGQDHVKVAQVIQQMLTDNLGINVDVHVMPRAQQIEDYISGKSLFFRDHWEADYPSPENFLILLYGKLVPETMDEVSYTNRSRYVSAAFDSLYEMAIHELDQKKRFDLYLQADQVAIDDAAILPIYYGENYRLLQQKVSNFDANPMEERDFSQVYFDPNIGTK
ncbi:MAG: ABC transporter substrate-binding protein [Flavobacteriales bacterium]|nr:ABC transporter substrate-binding protein [Flavobacteriales bacterium]